MRRNEDGSNSRRRVRLRPVRRRIGLLLILPLLSLVGLWAFATSISLGAALTRIEFTRTVDDVARPIGIVGNMLGQERTATAAVLASGGTQGAGQLRDAQKGTDAALAAFRQKSLPAAADVADGRTLSGLRDLDRDYGRLGALRAQVTAGSITPLEAIAGYNALFDSTNKALSNLATADDVGVYQTTQTLVNVNWARDLMLREDAVLAVSQAGGGRRLTEAEYAAFAQAAAARKHLSDVSFSGPSATVREAFRSLVRSSQYARYQQLEQSIVTSATRKTTASQVVALRSTIPAVTQVWWQDTLVATAALTAETESHGQGVVYRLALVGGLGLLVVVASIVLSLRFARHISRELRGLQQAAQELAQQRLPSVVARLRHGEEVDVDDEAPPLRAGRTKEIALVAEAFGIVQRTAVETAVGEAQIRKGISRVFINLAWRSQSLLHRQLRLLDSMERRTSDPDELADLFRLDHLTTRMRRHAEGLVILSGNENVRGWKEPVAVEHLLRAAVAEVEDYARVDVMALSSALVVGSVVADVVHLLAELIENAATFSPAATEVLVRAEDVGNGLAVEVVDRGVGLDADDIAAINRRLAEPPEFDLADSDRLGLFVVARLAARHNIEVTLQRSAYGGITAVALLPRPLTAVPEGRGRREPENERAAWQVTRTGRAVGSEAALSVSTMSGSATRPILADERYAPREPGLRSSPALAAPVPTHEPPDPPDLPGPPETEYPPDPGVEAYDIETGGLPRRTRQRHLAPQLRATPAVRRGTRPDRGRHAAGTQEEADDRPAELSRDLLSSLQTGWTAARNETAVRDEDENRSATVFDERMDAGES